MEIASDISLIDKDILENYAAVDIGNSQLKLLYENNFASFPYNSNFETALSNFLKTLSNKNLIFAISSVNPNIFEKFIHSLADYPNFKYLSVKDLLQSQTLVDFSQVSGTGEDRKMGIISGLLYSNPPFVTIDIGTATTINVLNEDKVFQGGAIFPGPITQINSLNQSATALKEFQLFAPTSIIGINTEESINSGIINGTVGAILFFLDIIQKDILKIKDFPIYLTGGSANLLYDKLQKYKPDIIYNRNLVLFGIFYLLNKGGI